MLSRLGLSAVLIFGWVTYGLSQTPPNRISPKATRWRRALTSRWA